MTTLTEQAPVAVQPPPAAPEPHRPLRGRWLQAQAINSRRHAAALRPFRVGEFGTGIAAPSDGHIQSVNALISRLRKPLLKRTSAMASAVAQAAASPSDAPDGGVAGEALRRKEKAHDQVRVVERIWDFYFELFGQRQGQYGEWLVGCDRVALDCYQEAYMGIASRRSIPAPPAYCYMRTGFSPATFRRGIRLKKLGQVNPFPLIQLPYHRLINPWTLGAILHEVSHNLQTDLGLSREVPRAIGLQLLKAGMPKEVAATWVRWNRETFADLSAMLLGGPYILLSLLDVVGRSPETVVAFSSTAPHPTPFLRGFLSIEVLRRMGFEKEAARATRMWMSLYPRPRGGNIPAAMLDTFAKAHRVVIDAICYRPYKSLGGKALSEIYRFKPQQNAMIEEAAHRLAAGTDPGVVPARFLIGAARYAFDRKLATPTAIASNFYKELARR